MLVYQYLKCSNCSNHFAVDFFSFKRCINNTLIINFIKTIFISFMKNFQRVTTLCLFLISAFVSAQSTRVTSAGVSIQGIARDANNSAIALANNIAVSIRIYKITNVQNNTQSIVLTRNASVRTDDFGVFSYVLDLPESTFASIGNFDAYIELSSNGVVFVNEKLQSVPYAIHAIKANNGVPTGSIMPFVGTDSQVPEGWLLCDGSAIEVEDYTADLRGLIGANTPNLNGVFLRGAGNQTIPTLGSNGNSNFGSSGKQYNGGDVNTFHIDRLKSHKHIINSLTGSPGDDMNTSNWTGERAVSPGNQPFGDFVWRSAEARITGTNQYAKRADGEHKHPKYLYSTLNDTKFVVSAYFIGTYEIPSINGVIQSDANAEWDARHQHRVYGETWNFPYGTPDDTSWAKPPPASNTDTAPVWYSINYIIKI